MLCENVEPMVHEFEKAYAGKMKFEIRHYAEGDSPERIARYGLDRHGMVITDQRDEKLWAESGHTQKRATVRAAIDRLLGG